MISDESGNRFFPTAVTDYWQDKAVTDFWRAMDPVVELSVIEVKSFYALMDDTSNSENIFLDTEEPQVQPNTSAGTHQWLF